eukprot:2243615-Rhodomonas_salina.1
MAAALPRCLRPPSTVQTRQYLTYHTLCTNHTDPSVLHFPHALYRTRQYYTYHPLCTSHRDTVCTTHTAFVPDTGLTLYQEYCSVKYQTQDTRHSLYRSCYGLVGTTPSTIAAMALRVGRGMVLPLRAARARERDRTLENILGLNQTHFSTLPVHFVPAICFFAVDFALSA